MSGSALLTGATGFVGGRVLRTMLSHGWRVAALVRGDAARLRERGNGEVLCCPYAGRYDDVRAALSASRPDVVVHLASCFRVRHTAEDLDQLVDANLRLGLQLAEAMAQAGCSRLVNAGTAWQHFEDRPYAPANLYAATKQALEVLLRYYADAHGLRVVTLKLFDTYGPGDRRNKLIPLLKRTAETGEPLGLSPGEQRIDLVHVDDAAAAFELAARRLLVLKERAGRMASYAVSSGCGLTLRELVREIEAVIGRPLPLKWGERPYREREVMRPWSRGHRLPGWAPRVALRDGLADVFGAGGR
jgi:nucleoside-diphosphate-sugar epimerase